MLNPKILGYLNTIIRGFNLLTVLLIFTFLENNTEIYFFSNILLIAFSCAPTILWISNKLIVNDEVKNQSDVFIISITTISLIYLAYLFLDKNNLSSVLSEQIYLSIVYVIFFSSGLCFESIKNAENTHIKVIIANCVRNVSNVTFLIFLYFYDIFNLTNIIFSFLIFEIIKNLILASYTFKFNFRFNFKLAYSFAAIYVSLLPFQINSIVDRHFLLLFEEGSDLTSLLYAERLSFVVYNTLYSGFIIHIHSKLSSLPIIKQINLLKQYTYETTDKRYLVTLLIVLIASFCCFIVGVNVGLITSLMTALFIILMPIRFCSGILNRIAFEGKYKLVLCAILFSSIPINYILNHFLISIIGTLGIIVSTAILEVTIFLSLVYWIFKNEYQKDSI